MLRLTVSTKVVMTIKDPDCYWSTVYSITESTELFLVFVRISAFSGVTRYREW